MKEFRNLCSKNQQNNKSNSNQTISNDSDNYKNNFNKNSTSQLITTSNSINFNSFENKSKATTKQTNKNYYFIANKEINLDLESIKFHNDKDISFNNFCLKDKKNNTDNKDEIKEQVLLKNNFDHKKIDPQIKFEFINKKKARLIKNEKNDKSEIKNDLSPNNNFQNCCKIENNIYNKNLFNENYENVKRFNKEEIIEDLRLNLLRNNLEANKNLNNTNFNKSLENLISKEVLFYQLSRLYTSRDNNFIKSFIIKKINELIIEDNIFENLLLLSEIKVLKDAKVNNQKLKKKKLKKLIELISNDRFFDLKSSNCK